MRMALTVWGNHLSPLCDASRLLLLVDLEEGRLADKRYAFFDYPSPFSRAKRLFELGIEVLICGAISEFLASMIEAYGIRTVSFVTGEVEQVLAAYLQDRLWTDDFCMSGGRARRHTRFRGGGKQKEPWNL
ncbi:MAG: NifB/NifX family molybdenum-iron cluster-binding protein [Thermodesulfobacteriota bacterium]|nr:NifB/NifX family molybdenum-iron cluster-binding protein [Thermodesulfobacteriota bacterium]